MYNISIKFEYDIQKSIANHQKHGVSLEEAQRLWKVSRVVIRARSTGESRYMAIGVLGNKFYSCVYTVRGGVFRLISARRSRKEEEEIYHEKIRQEKN